MEIIIGERGSGKTTELIERSAENGEFDKRTPILIDELDLVLGSIFNLEKVEAVTLTKREYRDIKYLEKTVK